MTSRESLVKLFDRDLNVLENEIRQYAAQHIWQIVEGTSNSGGNLCLHLCGNLRHYVGFLLGGIAYTRNRPYEFSAKDLSVEHLLHEIAEAKSAVSSTLQKLGDGDLDKTYPTEELGYPMTTGYFLIHLAGHLKYHTGQINYHRRFLTASRG